MLTKEVSIRYAGAFFEVALQHDSVEKWQTELLAVLDTIESSDFLDRFLKNPSVSVEAKKDTLTKLFKDRISIQLLNLLKVIVDRGRISFLRAVSDEYANLIQQTEKVVVAEVITAFPLGEDEKKAVVDALSALFACTVEGHYLVDPSVIGGVKVSIMGKEIDYTISYRLDNVLAMLNAVQLPSSLA